MYVGVVKKTRNAVCVMAIISADTYSSQSSVLYHEVALLYKAGFTSKSVNHIHCVPFYSPGWRDVLVL